MYRTLFMELINHNIIKHLMSSTILYMNKPKFNKTSVATFPRLTISYQLCKQFRLVLEKLTNQFFISIHT